MTDSTEQSKTDNSSEIDNLGQFPLGPVDQEIVSNIRKLQYIVSKLHAQAEPGYYFIFSPIVFGALISCLLCLGLMSAGVATDWYWPAIGAVLLISVMMALARYSGVRTNAAEVRPTIDHLEGTLRQAVRFVRERTAKKEQR